jgi:hypothetical protein
MKTIVYFNVLLLLSFQATCQELIPFRRGDRWGYADPSGKISIETVYDRTWFFTGDRIARVQQDGLFGFLDKAGTVKIKPQFIQAGDFVMGVAAVQSKTKSYCINLDGQTDECNPPDEDQYVDPEQSEHFTVFPVNGKYRIVINASGDTLPQAFDRVDFESRYFFPQTNYFAIVYQNGLKGAYNEVGVPIVPVKYKTMDLLDMESYKAQDNGKWGVVKFDGTIVLPFEYDSVNKVTELLFKEDRLNKNDHFIVRKGGKFGVVDYANNTILKTVYDQITIPVCSCPTEYVVAQNGLMGIYNYKGQIAIPLRYKKIDPFKGAQYTMVITTKGKEGYIDKNGFEYFSE